MDHTQLNFFTPSRISSYQNTTHESGARLREYELKADSQDRLILNYLKHHPYSNFTPSEVNEHFEWKNWDINGVRRCLTTWTKGYNGRPKLLVKTGEKREGSKGRNEYCWKWRNTNTNK